MNRLIPNWARVFSLAIMVALLARTAVLSASESEPFPRRVPRPYLALEPWPGFWPIPGTTPAPLPLGSEAEFERWERLRRALAERGGRPAKEIESPVLARGVGDRGNVEDPLAWESPEFLESWERVLAAAREGDSRGCARILRETRPQSLEGERRVRAMNFAARVSLGDLAAADSLYFRMTWNDRGRTAMRIRVWRALASGDGDRALQELGPLGNRTAGEQAAAFMAAWQAGSSSLPSAATWGETSGLARAAIALATAHLELEAGRIEAAKKPLGDLSLGDLPPAWRPPYRKMLHLTGEPVEGGEDPGVSAYREATRAFLAGQDADAEAQLTGWISEWPDSRFRAHAYLLRAHLRLVSGRLSEAKDDIQIVHRQAGEGEIEARALVLFAFVIAAEKQVPEAESLFEQVLSGPLGVTAEAELRFNQIRLVRLSGDEPQVEALLLELEEGFPGNPWPERARRDTDSKKWNEPARILPREPRAAVRIDAPVEGPWSQLLWGEDFLMREAARYQTVDPGRELLVQKPFPVHGEPESPLGFRRPMAFVDLGFGVPAALVLGGGLAGLSNGVHYRLDGAKTLAQERNDLPDYRRTDWEAGLGAKPGDVEVGLVLEGTARTDSEAPHLGLNPDPIKASWWGIRGDAGWHRRRQPSFTLSAAQVKGELDAGGMGVWHTDQTWLGLKGGQIRDGIEWDAEYTVAVLDQKQPGEPARERWYHHLRLTRSLSGGWYFGGRFGTYQARVLLLPVAGLERPLDGGWTIWAGTEPSLTLPSFREIFVDNGDWNLPDLRLPAERRYLDLRGGLRWTGDNERSFALGAEVFKIDQLRTWRRLTALWEEQSVDDATGFRATLSGHGNLGRFQFSARATAQTVQEDTVRVPYVPRYEGWGEVSYAYQGWRLTLTGIGIDGRTDENEQEYGSFLRWDLEAAYRFRTRNLPLGFRNLEMALGVQNLTDVEDSRWPGIQSYGFGLVAGVRALYGN